MIAYALTVYAATHPADAAAAYDEAYGVASDVGNSFVANWAAGGIALGQRTVVRCGAPAAEASRSVARLVELSRDGYRSGRVTHARVIGRDLAVLLYELGRSDVAAAVLGGCDGIGTVAVSVNRVPPQALDELTRGGGSEALRRSYKYGRRAKYADVLSLAGASSSRS